MTTPISFRRLIHLTLLTLLSGCFALHANAFAEGDHSEHSDKYLFICAGDQARIAPDFLAVINFDQESNDYGKVISTVPFAAPDATGNEPHHIGLSRDGTVVGCGDC